MKYLGKDCIVEFSSFIKSTQKLAAERISILDKEQKEDAFFIGDLGDIINKYRTWKAALPRVEPFYAVKCNDDHAVLKVLSDLGISFDCASKIEIQKILNLGVVPSRIIYANPCKQNSFIRYAATKNVKMMTFDNEAELYKVKAAFPNAQLVLRILPPSNFKVQCELGMKFGCHPDKALTLLNKAKELKLDVVGVSFHVGSGCQEASAFGVAIQQAWKVFQMGIDLGFQMKLLDIGGGFPGQKSASITFEEIADVVNTALDKYFPDKDVRIIAEPGRFFVASAFCEVVNIIAKRVVTWEQQGENEAILPASAEEPAMMYYVNDGVYGSFNCLLYDHATVKSSLIQDPESDKVYSSSVWGPTCDGLDCILQDVALPNLKVGDWLMFEDMGAYTMAAASTFNGMPRPKCYYYCLEEKWVSLYPEREDKIDLGIRAIPQMRAGHQLRETIDPKESMFGTTPTEAFVVGDGLEFP